MVRSVRLFISLYKYIQVHFFFGIFCSAYILSLSYLCIQEFSAIFPHNNILLRRLISFFICISIYVYIGNFLFIVFLVMHIFFHLSICISSILCSPSFSVHLFIHLNTLLYIWPFFYSIRWRGTADNWPEIWMSFSCDSTVKPQGTAIKILSVR